MTRLATHAGLIALDSPAALPQTGALPSRIVMLSWGENQTAQGPVTIGPKTLAASKLWPELGFEEVAIDFNHNTVPGHPSYQGEPAKIAAMSSLSVVEGVGLVFDGIAWTPDGVANRDHYKDLSPAVKLDEAGEVIFCHSAALARNGAVKGLHLFSAESIPADLAAKLTTLMAKADPAYSVKTATVHKPGTYMVNTDTLKKILSLPADATDDDINAALDKLSAAKGASASEETPAADAGAGDVKALSAQLGQALKELKELKELAGKGAKASEDLTTLTARLEASERELIVTEATAAGKQIPDAWLPDKDGKGGLPNAQLRTLCATLPEIIPLSARTPKNLKTTDGKPVLTATEKEVCRGMGLSEEQYLKHNV